ncbi:uncharacterized protein BDR25DRAFT_349945 [Lindgomyces ingoldianus]|uniref:Uncharacterized protein n=1 Tax=Lindgomyces ingoldianus TaxID=673940 RepID=A0ACB6RAA3_9PLEO|nr:uncharacterized protein BDR25DRAFT_349945 [Lindgomyces ingoldianus]KAF2475660.1 hypothetical protein BDR25DRAFT_349945 [Lindgomyces ingoldianus]
MRSENRTLQGLVAQAVQHAAVCHLPVSIHAQAFQLYSEKRGSDMFIREKWCTSLGDQAPDKERRLKVLFSRQLHLDPMCSLACDQPKIWRSSSRSRNPKLTVSSNCGTTLHDKNYSRCRLLGIQYLVPIQFRSAVSLLQGGTAHHPSPLKSVSLRMRLLFGFRLEKVNAVDIVLEEDERCRMIEKRHLDNRSESDSTIDANSSGVT